MPSKHLITSTNTCAAVSLNKVTGGTSLGGLQLNKKKFLPVNIATFFRTRFYRIPPGRLLVLVMSIAKKKQPPLNCNRVTSTYYIKEVTIVSKSDNSFIHSFIHSFI